MTSATITPATPTARRVAVAGAVGTVLEWYDYGLYGTASALVIGPLFFPTLDGVVGQLAAFATFAVGFLARPLGGVLLGTLGDRIGRKQTLLVTIVLMGATTVLMGLLPTYSTWGVAAPVLLVLLRLVQGFGAGAELAGALTYVSESTAPRHRAFLTSFSSAASTGGIFLATAVFALVNALTTPEQLLGWGWRIPFLVSILLVVVALVLRSRLEDSVEFQVLQEATRQRASVAQARRRPPLLDLLRHDTRSFFSGLLAPTAIGVVGYVTSVFGVGYIVRNVGMPPSTALVVVLAATGAGVVGGPLFGLLADRVGVEKVFVGGAVFGILFAFPFFLLLDTGSVGLIVLAGCLSYGVTWGAMGGSQGLFLPSLFRTRYRFTAVATTRELNSAIFAGPAPLVAAWLLGVGGGKPWLVALMVVVAMVLTIIGVLLGRRRRDDDLDGVSLVSPDVLAPTEVAPSPPLGAGK